MEVKSMSQKNGASRLARGSVATDIQVHFDVLNQLAEKIEEYHELPVLPRLEDVREESVWTR